MNTEDKSIYKWLVKRGSILLFNNGEKIHLELNTEGYESCLLTEKDTEELIELLTSFSKDIWENPDLIKQPYLGQLYKIDDNGFVYWDINQTKLLIGLNKTENSVEIKYSGEPILEIPVNYSVEIIQILTHYYNDL